MKKSFSPHLVAYLTLGLIAPLSAQNLVGDLTSSDPSLSSDDTRLGFTTANALPGSYEVPAIEPAQGSAAEEQAVFTVQDSTTLDPTPDTSRKVDSVVDLGVLRNPSPYRKILVSTQSRPYRIAEDSLQSGLARISATYRESGKAEKTSDCSSIILSIQQQLKLSPSQVLEIVEHEIAANPACSCEIVKTAITVTDASAEEVVAIVEAGIHASPESTRIISQCAIAAMPGSIAGVQALLAKLDPNAGRSGKSAKSAKNAALVDRLPDPLDRPPPFFLPPISPFPVTEVDPDGPSCAYYR